MSTPEEIRDTLELYLRGELDPAREADTNSLIQSDPVWQEIHAQLVREKQGIRYHTLQTFKNNLFEYETKLNNSEKNQEKEGDLSRNPALNYTTNDDKGVEVKTQSHEMEENYSIDKNTVKGIKYSAFRGQLEKLKQEEAGMGGSALPKKKGGRVVGMRRYWWAVAAGLLILVVASWPWIRPQTYAEKLIASGFVVPEMTDLVRGTTEDSIQMIVQKAYGAYAEGDYKLALKYFESIPIQENENYYKYYITTLILNKNQTDAITAFNRGKELFPNLVIHFNSLTKNNKY